VALTAEIADGWHAIFYSPREDTFYRKSLEEGWARPTARRTPENFEVACTVPVIINEDVEVAADAYRPMLALYIGGMGAREANFHNEVFARMGYEGEAKEIQDLYLDGKKDEAAGKVPTRLVEDIALIGPKEKIRDDVEMWRESVVTTMLVHGDVQQLKTIAELVLG
jgi:alkanesulfonate monooxygenase SsuD/methylene tetrahydromethanopterin reductase-like flavin-dependent oxidoreductase (luciferase family)